MFSWLYIAVIKVIKPWPLVIRDREHFFGRPVSVFVRIVLCETRMAIKINNMKHWNSVTGQAIEP